jgi:hypothetical protein
VLARSLATRLSASVGERMETARATKPTVSDEPARATRASPAATGEGSAAGPISHGQHPSHYWTWRLLVGGFTVEDCMAIRGCEREVVLDHALRSADAGWQVEPRWFFSSELLNTLTELIGPNDPTRIRPLLSRLPAGIRYEEVQLFLKCRSARQTSGDDLE